MSEGRPAHAHQQGEQPTRAEIISAFVPASPLPGRLGIELVSLGADRAELRLPFDPDNATMGEIVHGGAIAALIDTAGMAAAWADEERPDSLGGSTVSLHVDYLAPAVGKELSAVAEVVRRGRSLCFVEVRASEPDGRLVARGSLVYRFG